VSWGGTGLCCGGDGARERIGRDLGKPAQKAIAGRVAAHRRAKAPRTYPEKLKLQTNTRGGRSEGGIETRGKSLLSRPAPQEIWPMRKGADPRGEG